MYAMDVEDKEYWIYRLMVGQQFQSRGYGRKMLALVLTGSNRILLTTWVLSQLQP